MSVPNDLKLKDGEFNARERLTIILVLFLINILKPWSYSHEQKEFFNNIYKLIGIDRNL